MLQLVKVAFNYLKVSGVEKEQAARFRDRNYRVVDFNSICVRIYPSSELSKNG